jgi:hypothetical protein
VPYYTVSSLLNQLAPTRTHDRLATLFTIPYKQCSPSKKRNLLLLVKMIKECSTARSDVKGREFELVGVQALTMLLLMIED